MEIEILEDTFIRVSHGGTSAYIYYDNKYKFVDAYMCRELPNDPVSMGERIDYTLPSKRQLKSRLKFDKECSNFTDREWNSALEYVIEHYDEIQFRSEQW